MNKPVVAIMQPYFLPYIGYFQLINVADKFVIYDNIQYSRKGWINRNRILVNGNDEFITLPLKKDSDYLDINRRQLSDTFEVERQRMLRKISEVYRKAPYFESAYLVIERILNFNDRNLYSFINNSIVTLCQYLNIQTDFIVSSTLEIDHALKSEKRVLAIASKLEAQVYINPIGGRELYSKENFNVHNIDLKFLQPDFIQYKQFNNEFVAWLSILDVIMFNSIEEVKKMLNSFTLV